MLSTWMDNLCSASKVHTFSVPYLKASKTVRITEKAQAFIYNLFYSRASKYIKIQKQIFL